MKTNDIQLIYLGNEARVDSRQIADRLGVQHESSFRLLKKHAEAFEELGEICIEQEIQKSGGRPKKYACLNEDQCYLMLSLSRGKLEIRSLRVRVANTSHRQIANR